MNIKSETKEDRPNTDGSLEDLKNRLIELKMISDHLHESIMGIKARYSDVMLGEGEPAGDEGDNVKEAHGSIINITNKIHSNLNYSQNCIDRLKEYI